MEAVARVWYFDGISRPHLQVLVTQVLQKHSSGRETGGNTSGEAAT